MSTTFTRVESKVLEHLLAGDDPTLEQLRSQFKLSSCSLREFTGVGEYAYIELAAAADHLAGKPCFAISDVCIDGDESFDGACCVLYVRDGQISLLELAAYGDFWPDDLGQYAVKYVPDGERNLQFLRTTVGWPSEPPGA